MEEYTIESIDRNQPVGKAIGKYADEQFWQGFRKGLLLGIIVGGYVTFWYSTK